MLFKAKGFNHPDAGQALLRLIVKTGEGGLCQLKAMVQLITVAMDHDGHNRHRHQRKQRQLPADLRAHYQQHHAAHDQRVDQRQNPFPGRKHHPIHVVGGARNQIAGAVTQIKCRLLTTQLAIEIFAQLNRQLVGGTKQQHAPDIAQQIDHYCRCQHDPNPHHDAAGAHVVTRHAIDNHPDHMRWQQLQNSNNNQQEDRAQIAPPLPQKIPT